MADEQKDQTPEESKQDEPRADDQQEQDTPELEMSAATSGKDGTPSDAEKTAGDTDVAQSLKALQERIEDDTAGVRRSNMLIGVIGIILAIALFAYLGSLVSRLEEEIKPQNLAEAISGYVVPQIPVLADHLEADLKENAPEYVGQLFAAAEARLPDLRKTAEEGAMAILDKLLDDLEKQTNQAITQVVAQADRAQLKMAVDAAYEGKPADLEKYFREQLEEDIGYALDMHLQEKFYPQMNDIERQLDQLLTIPESRMTFEQKQKKELVTTVMYLVDEAAVETVK